MTGQEVICLYYHRVGPVKERLSVPPEIFRSQLESLAKKGYQTISIADLAGFLSGKPLQIAKPVIFSFDDGFLDFYLYAFPLLEKFGMRAVVFLVSEWMNDAPGVPKEFPQALAQFNSNQAVRAALRGDRRMFLNWETARELVKTGLVDFGSHTCSHRLAFASGSIRRFIMGESAHWTYEQTYGGKVRPGYPIFEHASSVAVRQFEPKKEALDKLSELVKQETGRDRKKLEAKLFERVAQMGAVGEWESEAQAHARITREMKESREKIEQELGVPCPSLCWPFGDYSELALEIASQCRYKMAFTTERGAIRKEDTAFALKRYRVEAVPGSWLVLELKALRLPLVGKIITGSSRSRKIVQQIK